MIVVVAGEKAVWLSPLKGGATKAPLVFEPRSGMCMSKPLYIINAPAFLNLVPVPIWLFDFC
jgi:hypothetical protein